MSNKLIPGDRVVVDAGLGITKTGNVQRITESTVFVKHYNGAVIGYKTQHVTKMISEQADVKPRGVGLKSEFEAFALVMEKKLTPAELKKREEVAQAMERENPGMDMSKKMAIATATAKKVAEETVEEAKAHTAPKTPKEKSLAALAHPKDKITHADVMVGRGVKKEEIELDEEQLDELSKETLGKYVEKSAGDMGYKMRTGELAKASKRLAGSVRAQQKMKEDTHYCAKHVFSERFGEGFVIEGSHAEPNEQGLIEWYDVDFGGTVRRVMTEKVKVMHAEYHMNHKKKMKEEDEIEEMSSKEKMKRGLYNKEEVELEEGFENLPGKATHLTNKDVRHPEHGIISGSTTLRHLGGNKYEVRAGRAKGKTVNLDKQHVQKMDEEVDLDEAYKDPDQHYAKQTQPMKDAINMHLRKGKSYWDAARAAKVHVKESVDLDEAMISYSDFQSKIDSHRKAGNQIKDDKYDKKKASYTVIDQDGAAKKITHTDAGVSQQHLGSMKRDDDESSETKSTEKRGRGRPAGSKSGARN